MCRGFVAIVVFGFLYLNSITPAQAGIFGRVNGRNRNSHYRSGDESTQTQTRRYSTQSTRYGLPPKNSELSKDDLTIRENETILNEEVIKIGGKSATGNWNANLCKIARGFTDWMGDHWSVSQLEHAGVEARSQRAMAEAQGNVSFAENLASFSGSSGDDRQDAKQCAEQWRNSPGHWSTMRKYWGSYCYTMVRTDSGNVFCTGLFANGIPIPKQQDKDSDGDANKDVAKASTEEEKIETTEKVEEKVQKSDSVHSHLERIPGYEDTLMADPTKRVLYGKSRQGDYVPLYIVRRSGDLMGGEHSTHLLDPKTEENLFKYYRDNPIETSDVRGSIVQSFNNHYQSTHPALSQDEVSRGSGSRGEPTRFVSVSTRPSGERVESREFVDSPREGEIIASASAEGIATTIGDESDDGFFKFIQFKRGNRYSERRHGAVLSDILNTASKMDRPSYRATHRDSDLVTAAHETTHGIHSVIRNLRPYLMMRPIPGRSGEKRSRSAAFYLGDGKAIVMEEPRILKKSQIAKFIPRSQRGDRYNLYIRGQTTFEDNPLYVFDEYTAYLNGSLAAVDLYKRRLWNDGSRDALTGSLEFSVFGLATAMALKEYEPEYFTREPQFKALLKRNLEKTMEAYHDVYNGGMKVFQRKGDRAILQKLRTNQDHESLRNFAKELFGSDWTERVLGF